MRVRGGAFWMAMGVNEDQMYFTFISSERGRRGRVWRGEEGRTRRKDSWGWRQSSGSLTGDTVKLKSWRRWWK